MNATISDAGLRLSDVVRREWFLLKLSAVLAGLPSEKHKAIQTELRGELTAAAEDVGMRQAIRDVGNVRTLGSEYLDAHGTPVPRVWAGLISLAVLLYGWLLAVISHIEGLTDAATALAPAQETRVTSQWLFSTAFVEVGPDGLGAFGLEGNTTSVLVGVLVFIGIPMVVARFWRVWMR